MKKWIKDRIKIITIISVVLAAAIITTTSILVYRAIVYKCYIYELPLGDDIKLIEEPTIGECVDIYDDMSNHEYSQIGESEGYERYRYDDIFWTVHDDFEVFGYEDEDGNDFLITFKLNIEDIEVIIEE